MILTGLILFAGISWEFVIFYLPLLLEPSWDQAEQVVVVILLVIGILGMCFSFLWGEGMVVPSVP